MAIAYAALMLGQDNEGDKNLRIIAIDPGSRKCGIAIAEQQGTLFRQVVATDEMEKAVKRLIATYRPLLIVVGDRTYGRRIAQLFEETLPVVFVDEHGSSEEARQRWVVNTFPDIQLSDTLRNPLGVEVQPFDRTKISKSFLYPTRVVESLNVCKDCLTGFFTCLEVPPMNSLLFQDGEEAFTPSIVTGFTGPGKTLLKSKFFQHILG